MKRILLSFIFLFSFIGISRAQVAVFKAVAFIDSLSQPGLKKYGIKLHLDGINVPVIFVTQDMLTGTMYYGDSIPNILNSNSTISEMNSVTMLSFALNANNTNDTIIHIQPFPMAENILGFSLLSSSSGLNCDGKLHFSIDTSDVRLSDFQLDYYDYLGNSSPLTLSPQNMDTMCGGIHYLTLSYKLTLSPSNYVYVGESFSFLIGQYAFPSITGLKVEVNTYKDATSPLCDGKARVSLANSNMPFLCSFDGGSYSATDSITNLCEGIHNVVVATASDTVGKYFVVSDAGSVINNPNLTGTVVDTIIYNYTNCNFNYNLPVDSAFLNSYMVIDSNTIFLSWQIWQSGISATISDTISYLYQTGNNMVSLNIFCGSARTNSVNSFKTFRINDYAYLSNITTSVKEKDITSNFEIYPNPFSNSISIKLLKNTEVKNIEIFNILGEKMDFHFFENSNEIVLTPDDLKKGFYSISITNGYGKTNSYKLIRQ